MDVNRIRAILEQLDGAPVEVFRLKSAGEELEIRFAAGPGGRVAAAQAPDTAAAAAGIEVTAPLPGLVYLAPAPDAPAFVQPGQMVAAGQTLVLIEAMKSMMPVTAPADGVVLELRARDQHSCEIGEVLCVLGRAGE